MRSLKKLGVSFLEEPSCEHCGNLEPFDATYDDGGTSWCMDCSACFEDDMEPTEEELNEIEKASIKKKISYFEGRISQLKKTLKELE